MKWIKCSYIPIPKDQTFLGYVKDCSEDIMIIWYEQEIQEFHGMFTFPDGRVWINVDVNNISHWMPLPEIPKDEE